MRGTLCFGTKNLRGAGIIPAYAGNTTIPSCTWLPVRDHPRVCGEHVCFRLFCNGFLGSSPRMRGTPASVKEQHMDKGIIPAYAGNTYAPNAIRRSWRDHPRVCGEHLTPHASISQVTGSSPRMRGTLTADNNKAKLDGIIPAYAGNTSPSAVTFVLVRDHPRVCGEHTKRL